MTVTLQALLTSINGKKATLRKLDGHAFTRTFFATWRGAHMGFTAILTDATETYDACSNLVPAEELVNEQVEIVAQVRYYNFCKNGRAISGKRLEILRMRALR